MTASPLHLRQLPDGTCCLVGSPEAPPQHWGWARCWRTRAAGPAEALSAARLDQGCFLSRDLHLVSASSLRSLGQLESISWEFPPASEPPSPAIGHSLRLLTAGRGRGRADPPAVQEAPDSDDAQEPAAVPGLQVPPGGVRRGSGRPWHRGRALQAPHHGRGRPRPVRPPPRPPPCPPSAFRSTQNETVPGRFGPKGARWTCARNGSADVPGAWLPPAPCPLRLGG